MKQRADRIDQQAVGRRSHGPARPVRSSASFEAVAAAPAPAINTDEAIRRTELPNGVIVVSERIPGVRSLAAGVWVRHGGAHERRQHEAGGSHLLEHMVFKGTRHRSAAEIALALERLGGSLDAYTTREHTSYQARVLDEHLPEAMDVLADLTLEPLLDAADLALEREVVLEEIAQVEDTPDDLVFELHAERFWKGHPYGRSVLGTAGSVAQMSADTLRSLHERAYTGPNLVVAVAGSLQHDDVVEQATEPFLKAPSGTRVAIVDPPEGARRGYEHEARSTAQTHLVFATNLPGRDHPDRYVHVLISAALGGGMSSRLFQRVREELGLCYSVFSFQSFYRAAGVAGVYVGTRPATADRAALEVRKELERVAEAGLPEGELEDVRRQVKGQIMLSLESPGARLHRLASLEMHDEPFVDLEALLARVDAVSEEDVRRVARSYAPDRHFTMSLGPDALGP